MIARLRKLARERRQELVRFLKFCVVGTIGTALDFGLLNLLYNVLGLNQVFSNVVSVSAGTINNYTWSRYWIYPETKDRAGARKFVQFVVVSVISLWLNTAILWVTDHWFLGERGLFAGLVAPLAAWADMEHSVLSSNAGKVIATGIVLFWNFFANRMWTFRDVDHVQPAPAQQGENTPVQPAPAQQRENTPAQPGEPA
ncbi:MAG: GtrA family protein [Anaerolineae bacterium]|nr:GtrA family protein [Anaerolineae bacterium]